MPLGETEVQGERWWVGKVSPRLHGGGRTGTIHQKTGLLKPTALGQIEDGCIHALRQAEIVGVKQWGLAVLVLTGLGTEAGRSAPDQGIQQRGCEHQHQGRGMEQRQQGADTEIDHVLQQQPATGELAPPVSSRNVTRAWPRYPAIEAARKAMGLARLRLIHGPSSSSTLM